MKKFNLKMNIKAQNGQGISVSHANQFQKQFNTYKGEFVQVPSSSE